MKTDAELWKIIESRDRTLSRAWGAATDDSSIIHNLRREHNELVSKYEQLQEKNALLKRDRNSLRRNLRRLAKVLRTLKNHRIVRRLRQWEKRWRTFRKPTA